MFESARVIAMVRLRIAVVCIVLGMAATLCPAQRIAPSMPPVYSADNSQVDIVKLSHTQPLIVIRFLGSMCSHCMRQIVALNERAPELRALNARVVAFSNNPPAKCAEVVKQYNLDTTVVSVCSDADNACSKVLGTTITESDASITDLHAILLIDRGAIRYEHYSTVPLMAFQDVLKMLAQ